MIKLFDTGLKCENEQDYVLVYLDGSVIRYSKLIGLTSRRYGT